MLVSEQVVAVSRSFSALQRAENSSMNTKLSRSTVGKCFSALQRAENSSIVVVPHHEQPALAVSVLFSEPKIPQLRWTRHKLRSDARFSALQRAENSSIGIRRHRPATDQTVSVLFSEPKIPQSRPSHLRPSIFPTAMITLRHS